MKKEKRSALLPCIFFIETKDGAGIPLEQLTSQELAAHKARQLEEAGRNVSRLFSDRPDLYNAFCQSDCVRKYDEEHFGV